MGFAMSGKEDLDSDSNLLDNSCLLSATHTGHGLNFVK